MEKKYLGITGKGDLRMKKKHYGCFCLSVLGFIDRLFAAYKRTFRQAMYD